MRSSSARLVVATLSLLSMCSTLTAAGAAHGGVRGAVTDDSGGVLPGVVVVATSGDEQVLGTAVTDETGSYAFNALPAGLVRLTFQLEGFAPTVDGLTIEAGTESRLDEQLTVISGTFYLGLGDSVDAKKATGLPAGGFHYLPAKQHHYAFSKGPAVVQVSGNGPFDITYLNPADDPQKKM